MLYFLDYDWQDLLLDLLVYHFARLNQRGQNMQLEFFLEDARKDLFDGILNDELRVGLLLRLSMEFLLHF